MAVFICAAINSELCNMGSEKYHSEEIHDAHLASNINGTVRSRNMSKALNVATLGEYSNAYRILIYKREGKRPVTRSRLRGEDTKMIKVKVKPSLYRPGQVLEYSGG
jgi:hypothetical protein